MVVAPVAAALEFFENGECPKTAGLGVSRHPENRVRGFRGQWVGRGVEVWRYRSGEAWDMPRATSSAKLGSLATGGGVPWVVEVGRRVGEGAK